MVGGIDNSTNLTTESHTENSCVPCIEGLPLIYSMILAANSLFCLPLQVWNIWLMVSPRITKKTDVIRLNMMIFIALVSLTNFLIMSGRVVLQYSSQTLWSLLVGLLTFGNPLFHCYVCVERYMAVVHPIIFLKYRPVRYRVQVLAPAWMALLICCGTSFTQCGAKLGNLPKFLVLQCISLVPFFVINSFCCVSILKALSRPSPGNKDKNTKKDRGGKKKQKETLDLKRSAFRAVALIQSYIVISYVPPSSLILSYNGMKENQFCLAYMANIAFVLMTSSLFSIHNLYLMGKTRWNSCLKGK